MTQVAPKLIMDDVEYDVSKFSQEVQNLLNVRQQWLDEAAVERSKLIKTEAALRQLDIELTEKVKVEIEAFPAVEPVAEPVAKPRKKASK